MEVVRALLTLAPLPCGSTLYVVQVDMKWYASRESTVQRQIFAAQIFRESALESFSWNKVCESGIA